MEINQGFFSNCLFLSLPWDDRSKVRNDKSKIEKDATLQLCQQPETIL
jgi:hypothetical protein